MRSLASLSASALLLPAALAVSISEINGNRFLSSYNGETVSNVRGLVTAKGSSGFYIRSTSPDNSTLTSESLYVYGSSAVSKVSVGDIITLGGKISEYRSNKAYVYLTELTSPSDITVVSSDNEIIPLVIGSKDLNPPTEQFSALDEGNIFRIPNNASQISSKNAVLQPTKYGMDFWESLSGELVTIGGLNAITKPNQYGDTWVIGNWTATGRNERGGLTMQAKDSNPEAIIVGSPLDGTKNPTDTKVGDTIDDITGIITQAYGYYALLPLTKLSVTGSNSTSAKATELVSDGTCSGLTVGSYNVNNLSPNSSTLTGIAGHIAKELNSPSLVFLQEIQDDDGATNDGVISANKTLSTLADSIKTQGGITYDFINIDPVDGADGGQPGGNIRVAYLYDPKVLQLRSPNPSTSTQSNEVLSGAELKYNPGLIDPSNSAWDNSRKPLIAAWETLNGKNKFFTINVHFTSKGGGSSIDGDARPPVNGGVAKRESQAKIVANFITDILAEDSKAKIITSGDFNEFAFVQPLTTFTSESKLKDIDDVVDTPAKERYTYLYDSNCQQLDHMYISEALTEGAKMEHIHVNTWVSYDDQRSDHDPTVALLNVCEA
ncbi:endonuclease/exonuclease/phosphatase family protein [Aspergillus steynii IBT 23096]|uniref:Endonuclease/exonuclease/phosphatase family protein n=1 Tax=Aspergillus steynii IBT 23096 TaxID=1392250 RepID=A0A2I2GF42_9EURO|nr:endonuclease/exonuclease/phosphatase family protein [Aspergillus steynii IBT 23096]PLB51471.1 endonuclease/exonuclease/phosphatase family protein [Aspergillus steynii IBT 23096]